MQTLLCQLTRLISSLSKWMSKTTSMSWSGNIGPPVSSEPNPHIAPVYLVLFLFILKNRKLLLNTYVIFLWFSYHITSEAPTLKHPSDSKILHEILKDLKNIMTIPISSIWRSLWGTANKCERMWKIELFIW